MKQLLFISIIAAALTACSDNPGATVDNKTSTDTITNVTNPGVGSVADDTATHDNDTSH